MNGVAPHLEEQDEPSLMGGAFGLRCGEIEEAMSAYFTLKRTTFHDTPAWRLEQSSGPELLPFAVHHRNVRQAVTHAQQVAGLMRCVVLLDERHRVVRGVKAVPDSWSPAHSSRS